MAEFDTNTFCGCMNKQMHELGVSLRDLEKYTGMTYEHVRRLSKGTAKPSKAMLKMVCDCLQLEYRDMYWLVVADKVRSRYGRPVEHLLGQHPELVLLQQAWPRLSGEDRSKLLSLAETLAGAADATGMRTADGHR